MATASTTLRAIGSISIDYSKIRHGLGNETVRLLFNHPVVVVGDERLNDLPELRFQQEVLLQSVEEYYCGLVQNTVCVVENSDDPTTKKVNSLQVLATFYNPEFNTEFAQLKFEMNPENSNFTLRASEFDHNNKEIIHKREDSKADLTAEELAARQAVLVLLSSPSGPPIASSNTCLVPIEVKDTDSYCIIL